MTNFYIYTLLLCNKYMRYSIINLKKKKKTHKKMCNMQCFNQYFIQVFLTYMYNMVNIIHQ